MIWCMRRTRAAHEPSTLSKKTWTLQGYNLMRWTTADMAYWAVSDISLSELEDFAHDIQTQN
jgi:anti-sigma factor RsiW